MRSPFRPGGPRRHRHDALRTVAAAAGALLLCHLAPPALLAAQALPSPNARAHHALVYDESRQQVILTGGSTPLDGGQRIQYFGDTWAFDGTRWTLLDSSAAPMAGMRLFVDAGRRVRSMGGAPTSALRTLVGGSWQVDADHPDLRAAEPGVAYDRRRDRLVVFGGSVSPTATLHGTWEHDGTTWITRDIANPPARQAHLMAFDARRGRAVMFGGVGPGDRGQAPTLMDDLWEYDGVRWEQRATNTGPSPRRSAGVTYDSKRGRVVIFGGIDATGMVGDTWAWDGRQWSRLATTGPTARTMGYMAYDARRDRIVLFGGRLGWPHDAGDTWEFDGSFWRQVQPESVPPTE